MSEPELDKQVAVLSERLDGMKIALSLAHAEYERRLSEMNRFREEHVMDAATYLPRSEWNLGHESVQRRMAFIEKMFWTGAGVLIAVSALTAVVARLIWK